MKLKGCDRWEIVSITKTLLISRNKEKIADKIISKFIDNYIYFVNIILEDLKNYNKLTDNEKELYSELLGKDVLQAYSLRLKIIEYLERLKSDKCSEREVFENMSRAILRYLYRI